jgi:hypothetical protein
MCTIRATLIVIAVTLLACSPAPAAILVEVQVVEAPAAAAAKENHPTTRPAGALPTPPKDAKVLLSTQMLARPREPFLTRTTLGDQTIQLKGQFSVSCPSDGPDYYRVSLDYSNHSATTSEQITSEVMLKLNEPATVGGLVGSGESSRLIVLTLKDQPIQPNAKAGGE